MTHPHPCFTCGGPVEADWAAQENHWPNDPTADCRKCGQAAGKLRHRAVMKAFFVNNTPNTSRR